MQGKVVEVLVDLAGEYCVVPSSLWHGPICVTRNLTILLQRNSCGQERGMRCES